MKKLLLVLYNALFLLHAVCYMLHKVLYSVHYYTICHSSRHSEWQIVLFYKTYLFIDLFPIGTSETFADVFSCNTIAYTFIGMFACIIGIEEVGRLIL